MDNQILNVGIENVEDKVISISLERYEELVKKETLYDKITSNKDIELYLISKKEAK